MTVYGVDIHARYQAGISFPKLKAEGYGFAAMKLTEGTSVSYVESAKSWIPAIRKAGLIPGGYHWIGAGNGAGQADYFYDACRALGGPGGMLIQLDCEDDARLADVDAWVKRWNQLTNHHPFFIYSGKWWWQSRGWNGAQWTPYLWNSHYLSADANTVSDDPVAFANRIPDSWWTPGYGNWKTSTILQFTSKGDAGTLGNKVDLNVYRGSLDSLKSLARIIVPPKPTVKGTKMILGIIDGDATVYRPQGNGCVAMVDPAALKALVAAGATLAHFKSKAQLEDALGKVQPAA